MIISVEGMPGLRKHCLARGIATKMAMAYHSPNREYVAWSSKSMVADPRRWTFTTMLAALAPTAPETQDYVVVGSAETAFRCYSPVLREYLCTGENHLLATVAQRCHRPPDATVFVDASCDQTMLGVNSRDHTQDHWITWSRADGLAACYQQVMKTRPNVLRVAAADFSSEANVDRVVERLRVFLSGL